MSHFAKIDRNWDNGVSGSGTVTSVWVIEQDVVDSGMYGHPSEWVQCSYNTKNGVHALGGTPVRQHFPGPGFWYDAEKDIFIPPRPMSDGILCESWILNEEDYNWWPPIPLPSDAGPTKLYVWDETVVNWVERIPPSTPTP